MPGHRLQRALSPGIADKLRRALWGIIWALLFRPTPPPLHGWRRFLLRLFGATIATGARPYGSAHIWAPWNLEMGERSVIGPGVQCYNVGRIVLGAGVTVSHRVFLCSATRDFRDGFALLTGTINIQDGAWVAAEAYVGPGLTLGRHSVVAARAVVTRDVEPFAVVAGNPARVISTVESPSPGGSDSTTGLKTLFDGIDSRLR